MRKPEAPVVEDDPILAEVRQWKAEVWKDAGETLEGLFRRMRETQEKVPQHLRVDRSSKAHRPYPGDEPES